MLVVLAPFIRMNCTESPLDPRAEDIVTNKFLAVPVFGTAVWVADCVPLKATAAPRPVRGRYSVTALPLLVSVPLFPSKNTEPLVPGVPAPVARTLWSGRARNVPGQWVFIVMTLADVVDDPNVATIVDADADHARLGRRIGGAHQGDADPATRIRA